MSKEYKKLHPREVGTSDGDNGAIAIPSFPVIKPAPAFIHLLKALMGEPKTSHINSDVHVSYFPSSQRRYLNCEPYFQA